MKYAVSYMNFWDNEMEIQIVEASGWKDALSKHTGFNKPEYPEDHDMSWISDDMKDAKSDMFNADMVFDVIEIEEMEKRNK